MTDQEADKRKGDRRKLQNPDYTGEERRKGDRREGPPAPPKPD